MLITNWKYPALSGELRSGLTLGQGVLWLIAAGMVGLGIQYFGGV